MTEATLYALFKDGKQVSKAHSTIEAARTEAFEAKAIIHYGPDFGRMNNALTLADGYTIQLVTQ